MSFIVAQKQETDYYKYFNLSNIAAPRKESCSKEQGFFLGLEVKTSQQIMFMVTYLLC